MSGASSSYSLAHFSSVLSSRRTTPRVDRPASRHREPAAEPVYHISAPPQVGAWAGTAHKSAATLSEHEQAQRAISKGANGSRHHFDTAIGHCSHQPLQPSATAAIGHCSHRPLSVRFEPCLDCETSLAAVSTERDTAPIGQHARLARRPVWRRVGRPFACLAPAPSIVWHMRAGHAVTFATPALCNPSHYRHK
jgi:hypothetical protein